MRILILGGSGFIGTNLKRVIDAKSDVLSFSRSAGHDLRDYEASSTACIDFEPDVIFNLACHGGSLHYVTKFAADVINDNIAMSLNLYKIAQSLPYKPLIVNAISNCSYPGDSGVQSEPNWLSGSVHDSVFPFASSKRTLYCISKCYYRQYGINSVNLIFPNAFGVFDHTDPNKTHAIDGIIIRMIKAKRAADSSFEVWGPGSPVREWIFVEDFCNILIAGSYHDAIIEPVNVAQGKGYSIKESVEMIRWILGYEGDLAFNTSYPDGDPVKILDDTMFKSVFSGYEFVNHEEALRRTIQYYEEIL